MSTFTDSFISTSELQKNTKKCFEWLDKIGKKVILSNNKPRAILISVDEYDRLSRWKNIFPEVVPNNQEIQAIRNYESKKAKWENTHVEAFSFLESIK